MTDCDLKKQVAEQVMGWRALKPFWADSQNNQKAMLKDWSPITNPADWMQVVERVIELGVGAYTRMMDALEDRYSFREWMQLPNSSKGEAICLAALKAVGADEN